mgnify:FL=1
MIRFLLNAVEHQVENTDPSTLLLAYLRDHLGKTGTKEGCASGVCGACTVVLGELFAGELRFRAINACLTPLGSIHGRLWIRVGDLKEGPV